MRQRTGDRGTGKGNYTSAPRGEPDGARKTASGREPVQRDHRAHGGLVAGQARTLKAALEYRIGVRFNDTVGWWSSPRIC